jgi:hypothetical protein
LLDGHKDSCFGAAPRHHLRPFALSGVKQLTEARLGVLHGPDRHAISPAD